MILCGNFIMKIGVCQLDQPQDIVFDTYGNMFITDYMNNRVLVYNSSGNYLSQIGSSGTGDGQFSRTFGIAIDSSNNLFVVDHWNNRIQKFINSP